MKGPKAVINEAITRVPIGEDLGSYIEAALTTAGWLNPHIIKEYSAEPELPDVADVLEEHGEDINTLAEDVEDHQDQLELLFEIVKHYSNSLEGLRKEVYALTDKHFELAGDHKRYSTATDLDFTEIRTLVDAHEFRLNGQRTLIDDHDRQLDVHRTEIAKLQGHQHEYGSAHGTGLTKSRTTKTV